MAVELRAVPGAFVVIVPACLADPAMTPALGGSGAGWKNGAGPSQSNRSEAPLRAHERSHRRFDEAGILQSEVLASRYFAVSRLSVFASLRILGVFARNTSSGRVSRKDAKDSQRRRGIGTRENWLLACRASLEPESCQKIFVTRSDEI